MPQIQDAPAVKSKKANPAPPSPYLVALAKLKNAAERLNVWLVTGDLYDEDGHWHPKR